MTDQWTVLVLDRLREKQTALLEAAAKLEDDIRQIEAGENANND